MSLLHPPPGEPVVRLSSPADIARAVPQLLGFNPAASLVILGLAGERRRLRMTLRADLPASGDEPGLAGYLADRMSHERLAACILVLFTDPAPANEPPAAPLEPVPPSMGPRRRVRGKQGKPRRRSATPIRAEGERARMPGGATALAVDSALRDAGLDVPEVLRVEDGRWWSYACELSCCPPQGSPIGGGPASLLEVLRVAAGRPIFADRDALVASVARADGEPGPALAAAVEERARFVAARHPPGRGITDDLTGLQALLARDTSLLQSDSAASLSQPHNDQTLAFVAVALRLMAVRDASFAWTGGPFADAAIALWRELVRRVPPPYAAAPATLLAVAAYRRGDGATADVYLRRALEDDPGYRMADLILTSLEQGFHPADMECVLGIQEPEPAVRPHGVQGSRRSGGADAR